MCCAWRHLARPGGDSKKVRPIQDGDVLCHPALVIPYLAVDTANEKIWCRKESDVPDLDNTDQEWRIADVRALAAVATAVHGTLGHSSNA